MLSRTADNLFWIARYMERAETAARLLEVGARISLLPSVQGLSQRMGQPASGQRVSRGFRQEIWRAGAAQHRKPSVF